MRVSIDKELDAVLKGRGVETVKEQEKMIENQAFLSTSVPELDEAIGTEEKPLGIPLGSITEISGESGTGKSTLCYNICAQPDVKTLYIDTEKAFRQDVKDNPDFKVIRVNRLDKIWGILNDIVPKNIFDVIVVDSIGATSTPKVLESDTEVSMNAQMQKSVMLKSMMEQLIDPLSYTKTALVFSNHAKVIPAARGIQYTTVGGSSTNLMSRLRLRLTGAAKSSYKTNGDEVVGKKTKATIIKNNYGENHKECEFLLKWR